MDLKLQGKVAMVSGASKGLGYAVADLLAREGARVSIASSNRQRIEAAAERIRKETGAEILPHVVDVRSAEQIEAWKDETLRQYLRVDLLFANSGGPPAGGFLNFDDPAWQNAFELLVLSFVRMTRCVIPVMKENGGGSIVLSTSSSVKEPIPNLTLSNVLRGSVSALSKTLAHEFATDGIRVNHVIPGRIGTDRLKQLDEINARKQNIPLEEHRSRMQQNIPLRRYGRTDEFAAGVVFLLSGSASYITGATLQIDGGIIRSVL